MAAPDRRPASSVVSVRRYINFKNPIRILHQNVNSALDVRQWIFESATVVDCRNGTCRSENWPGGWICATVVQSGDAVPGSGPIQGCMSLDIVYGDEKPSSTYHTGNIVSSKTVSSVVASPGPDGGTGTLLTLVADGSSLHLTKVEHVGVGPVTHGLVRSGAIDVDDATDGANANSGSSVSSPAVGGGPASSSGFPSEDQQQQRRRGGDKDRSSSSAHDEGGRRPRTAFEAMNGSVHSGRERTSGSSSGGKQKERRRQEEECSPRGGESKRQKTHHDPRVERDPESSPSSSSASVAASRAPINVEGNQTDDGVNFLNNYVSGSLSGAVDGALPSPVCIETPGFNDLMVESEDEDRHRAAVSAAASVVASSSSSSSLIEESVGVGYDNGYDDVVVVEDDAGDVPSSTDPGVWGVGRSATGSREDEANDADVQVQAEAEAEAGAGVSDEVRRGEDGVSNNNDVPPVLQIEEGSSRSHSSLSSDPCFEGVFNSLMRLLGECKDKNGKMTSAGESLDSKSLVAAAASAAAATASSSSSSSYSDPGSVRLPTLEELLGGRVGKPVVFNRPEFAPKPVCEIRPFVDSTRGATAAVPPVAAAASSSRNRGGGSSRRRNQTSSASTARAPRSRRTTRQTRSAGGRGRGNGGSRSRRSGPILIEDGLEVVEPIDVTVPSVEEETAMAAAMLEDLIDLDYD